MKPRHPLTPAKPRIRQHSCPNTFAPADTTGLPPLATHSDGIEEDATGEWLAHIRAGRIEVK